MRLYKLTHLDGKVELKIPEGTQTGTAFRVKGKGIPYLRNPNQRGDQHIVVTVQTPKKLTDTQRELLLRFANESNEDVNNLQVSKSLFVKNQGLFNEMNSSCEGMVCSITFPIKEHICNG